MRSKINVDPFFLGDRFVPRKKNGAQRIIRKSFIRRSTNSRWFEVDSLSEQKNSSDNKSLGLVVSRKTINLWLAVLLASLLILVGRTAYLQLWRGSYFSSIAEGNRLRIRDIKANRGVIYDRHRNLLVENVPGFSLAIVPVDLEKEKQKEIADQLSAIAEKSTEEILQIIAAALPYSYQPITIEENLTQDQAMLVEILASRYPGVILKIDNTRDYLAAPGQLSLSHVLGYPGKIEEDKLAEYLVNGYSIDDYVGKAGLELFYERVLKGENGKEQVEVDATGQAKEVLASKKPIPGQNLVLTIDSDLQRQAEIALKRSLGAFGKKKGAVVVLDPNSGEVLALVNLPAFDNNLFSQGIGQEDFSALINDPNQPLFNRAISGEYPSGSTFKLIVAAAALEEGLITSQTSFQSVGGIAVASWFFEDWKAGGHGWTNIYKAIAESVNTFFYIIGGGYEELTGLGVSRIREYAEKFGLSQKLGIDLPSEAAGFLPSKEWKEGVKKERWYIGDTYNLSIGQGDILVTPLQIAGWTSVFASAGKLYRPYLVKEILDNENNVVTQIKPQILNQDFISPENIKIVNVGLRQAVLTGSARGLSGLPVAVAAKTGTAQWSSKYQNHAWLTAFAPYQNPQIVVTVLVEEGGEGSTAALPVAYEIINWWAANR